LANSLAAYFSMPAVGKGVHAAGSVFAFDASQGQIGIDVMDALKLGQFYANCAGCCFGCPWFLRFDICAPEYSTAMLDLYADIANE